MSTIFALDENLGFPLERQSWINFFREYAIVIENYSDMGLLTRRLVEQEIAMSYLPVANYYSIKDDPRYIPVLSSISAKSKSNTMTSVLVVRNDSDIYELQQLRNLKIGYIHSYCTTSYFALILLLEQHRFSIHNFFEDIVEVGAWQKQIDAVVAKRVAATMVYKDVWLKNPENAQTTRIIAEVTGLPTPLIIVSQGLSPRLREDFLAQLGLDQQQEGESRLFAGFVPYAEERISILFEKISNGLCRR